MRAVASHCGTDGTRMSGGASFCCGPVDMATYRSEARLRGCGGGGQGPSPRREVKIEARRVERWTSGSERGCALKQPAESRGNVKSERAKATSVEQKPGGSRGAEGNAGCPARPDR